MDPISQSVCHWQAFLTQCSIMLQLIGQIQKLRRKLSIVNTVSGVIFITLHCLCNLRTDPISQSVYHLQVFLTQCSLMLQIIGHIHKLQRKLSIVNMVSGVIFTTLHCLRNLQIDPISQSVYHLQVFLTQCSLMLQIIGHIHKLQRKLSIVNTVLGVIFITLHCLRNLQIDPISQSVCHLQAFLPQHSLTLQLIGHIHKLRRK